MKELPTGIRRTATGYQTYVWVIDPTHPKGGLQASKRWPASSTLSEMKQWRMKRKLNLPETLENAASTFAEDVADYLQRDKVRSMPTAQERVRHMGEWIAIFGHRERKGIQPQDIQRALDTMRGRLAAGSVNKRRTALMDFWTTLDGRHQANPVKATIAYTEPRPEPRAPALATVLKVLAAMPAGTDYARKCRARVKVIAWTGWPHKILKQVQPEDIDWKQKQAFVNKREKGKGAPARVLPLLPEAIRALREFDRADAYGPFSNSSLHKKFAAARKKVKGAEHVRPYDFRHFFGTLIATITKDERAVQELMLLSTVEQARRYTAAATDPRVQAAVAEVAEQLPGLRKAAKSINKRRRPRASRVGRTTARRSRQRLAESGRVSPGSASATVRERPV